MAAGHLLIDQRSLAFGRAIAARLLERPELIDDARSTLAQWMTTCSARARSTLLEWQAALQDDPGALDRATALLTGTDERAIRLRQSNPFAGVLSAQERTAILLQFSH